MGLLYKHSRVATTAEQGRRQTDTHQGTLPTFGTFAALYLDVDAWKTDVEDLRGDKLTPKHNDARTTLPCLIVCHRGRDDRATSR